MKIYLVTALVVSFGLVGCNQSKDHTEKNTSMAQPTSEVQNSVHGSQNVQSKQVIHFTGPYDLTLTLETDDNFETAKLTDNSDKSYQLKRTISANGIRMENTDNGVTIHFKATDHGNEGFVELVKDKAIEIKEFKQ